MSQAGDAAEGLTRLSDADIALIHECLTAAVDGPFFPEWEFHMLFGLERDEVRQVAAEWPAASNAEIQDCAVTNTLNNLIGYPHRKQEAWPEYISATPAYVREILDRWCGADRAEGPKGYFDRLR